MKILNLDSPKPESHPINKQLRLLPRTKRRKPSTRVPPKRKDMANNAGKITMARDPTVRTTAEIATEATEAKTEETTTMAGTDRKKATTATTTRVATTRTAIGTTKAMKEASPEATINNATTTTITIIDLTSSATGHHASTKSDSTSQRWTLTPTIDSFTAMTLNSL
jgi:hypothetical protein